MSAAVDNFKKGWLLAVFSLASTLIGVVVTSAMSGNREDATKLYEKIESKADKVWVEQRISDSEEKQRIDREWMMKTLDRIDKRTERLEDRIK